MENKCNWIFWLNNGTNTTSKHVGKWIKYMWWINAIEYFDLIMGFTLHENT